jgi:Uma2 family endonuclease
MVELERKMPEAALDLSELKHYPPAPPPPEPVTVPNGSFTYGDYKRWNLKPNQRVEVIHGMVRLMAAPKDRHQAILIELALQIGTFLKEKPCKIRVAPYDVRLFYREDETDDTVVQPDISVICDQKKLGEEGCHGAPDLVVEILSPSNSAAEMSRKLELYREAGIREYWLVNPEDETVTAHLLKDGKYVLQIYKVEEKLPSAVLAGLEIDLKAAFAG